MNVNLQVETRHRKGKRSRNILAGQGKTPAVLYGRGIDSRPVAVDTKEIGQILKKFGTSQVLDLHLDDELYKVMIKDLQIDPISQQLVHVDFLNVDLTKVITTFVPVRLVGEPAGTKDGGIVQQQLREVEVECLPTDIPEAIEVDISHLEVGDGVHISDLAEDEKVEFLTTSDTVIASLVAQTEEEEEEEEETELIPGLVSDDDESAETGADDQEE